MRKLIRLRLFIYQNGIRPGGIVSSPLMGVPPPCCFSRSMTQGPRGSSQRGHQLKEAGWLWVGGRGSVLILGCQKK